MKMMVVPLGGNPTYLTFLMRFDGGEDLSLMGGRVPASPLRVVLP